MRTWLAPALLAGIVLVFGSAKPCFGQEMDLGAGLLPGEGLDLMDLEIPGQGAEDQVELPPLEPTREEQGPQKAETARPAPGPGSVSREEPAAAATQVEAVTPPGRQAVGSPGPAPETTLASPARAPLPDMVPLLLGETGTGWEVHKSAGAVVPAPEKAATEVPEVPVELKPLRAPPPSPENLKGTGTAEEGGGIKAHAATPEIPLLTDEDKGLERLGPAGRGSSLAIKPLSDLYRGNGRPDHVTARSPGAPRRPEDYLQIRDDIDPRLIKIYERFYKDR